MGWAQHKFNSFSGCYRSISRQGNKKSTLCSGTFDLMIQTWWDPLDKAHRLMYADVFLYSAKPEVFYVGNNTTEKFLGGHLFIKSTIFPPLLSRRTCSHWHLSHKMLIIFILYVYQNFVKYRTASSRSKPSKAKAKFISAYNAKYTGFSFLLLVYLVYRTFFADIIA